MALVLDGKAYSKELEAELSARVAALKQRTGNPEPPILATILVGSDPASATYVKMKGNACRRVGMESLSTALPEDATTQQLLAQIDQLNANPRVRGILLQHPVPKQIDERACFDRIALEKDVDGVTSLGFGRMAMGEHAFGSATPAGIMRLLRRYDIEIKGREAVVVGRSPILGKPMAMMLLAANATVTICHSRTKNLPDVVPAQKSWSAQSDAPSSSKRIGFAMEPSSSTPDTTPAESATSNSPQPSHAAPPTRLYPAESAR